jgi:alanyl-tRNA synthetase
VIALVVSCEPLTEEPVKKIKKGSKGKTPAPKWHVVLSETVLYPEGGGQPSDFGTINGGHVEYVEMREGKVLHVCAEPHEVGSQVQVVVDWNRRFDHMQQHTGQHVLSSVADSICNAPTVSWELSSGYVNVDLAPERELTAEDVSTIEAQANQEIRNMREVRILVLDGTIPNDNPPHLRGKLPPVGTHTQIRLIELDGLDVNACGGTHVRSTAELQLLKILRVEKAKGNTRLVFAVGGRVLDALSGCLIRQSLITSMLASGPEEHVERIDTLLKEIRSYVKRIKTLSEELARLQGRAIAESGSKVVLHHVEGADLSFLQMVASAAQEVRPESVYFLSAESAEAAGKHKDVDGVFLLVGPPKIVDEAGKAVAAAVLGKGGGKGGTMQGKATNLEKRMDIAAILEEAMKKLSV